MACIDYLETEAKCSRGIPVAHLFRHFFCELKPEKCPIVLWEVSSRAIDNTKSS